MRKWKGAVTEPTKYSVCGRDSIDKWLARAVSPPMAIDNKYRSTTMTQISLSRLNANYESDPNVAIPLLGLYNDELTLIFALNYFTFPYKEDEKGRIKFSKCAAIRIGGPNDEGFLRNQHPLWNASLGSVKWHSFYEVMGTPTEHFEAFYKNGALMESAKNLRHFVFFMKEATFECLAESYKEEVVTSRWKLTTLGVYYQRGQAPTKYANANRYSLSLYVARRLMTRRMG